MSFIGLTKNNGEKIAIHFKYVITIEEDQDTDGCRIYLRDGNWIDVAESYHSIYEVMNRHGVNC